MFVSFGFPGLNEVLLGMNDVQASICYENMKYTAFCCENRCTLEYKMVKSVLVYS